MIVRKPYAILVSITPNAEELIEAAGRTCYKSEAKTTKDSARKFIRKIKRLGHYSVLEHAYASFKFVCDRGVTHEMVRHRLASYSQESTRYCNYGRNRFGGQIQVIKPTFKLPESDVVWDSLCRLSEMAYMRLLELGESPQMARSVLPTCLKAEIVMTCNFREWLHVFALRAEGKAGKPHPQIKDIMSQARSSLISHCPSVFGD